MTGLRRVISFALLLSAFFATSACAQTEPVISDGKITFSNGRVLEFVAHRESKVDPREALEKKEPVSIQTEPLLVRSWGRLLLVRTESYFEGRVKKLSVLDWDGKQLCEIGFLGDLHVLEHAHRILIAQESAHYLVDESLILDPDCNVVARISQPESVVSFGVSDDEKLFWVVSYQVIEGNPATRVSVYDLHGEEIAKTDVYAPGPWTFEYAGQSYTIELPAPDYPG